MSSLGSTIYEVAADVSFFLIMDESSTIAPSDTPLFLSLYLRGNRYESKYTLVFDDTKEKRTTYNTICIFLVLACNTGMNSSIPANVSNVDTFELPYLGA